MRIAVLIAGLLTINWTVYAQNAKTYKDLAEAKMEQKDYKYAMTLIDKAIQLDSTDTWLYLTKAEIQFNLTGSKDACPIVKHAIQLDPNNPEPYNRLGSYYDSRGILDSSIAMYDLAFTHAKNDSSKYAYLHNCATAKATAGDLEGARKDFEAILEFDPVNIAALNNISSVYIHLGMTEKGIRCLKKIIAIDSSFIGPYVNLGFTYTNLDSLDLAIDYFAKALSIDPNDALSYNNRGHAYYKKGDYKNALSDINRSITLYPTNSYAYRNLALVYIATKNMNEACMALTYAQRYGYDVRYGNEVNELFDNYCKK